MTTMTTMTTMTMSWPSFSAGTRFRRDAADDINKAAGQAQDDIENFFEKIYGEIQKRRKFLTEFFQMHKILDHKFLTLAGKQQNMLVPVPQCL